MKMKANSHLARKPARSKTILLERWLTMASAASLLAMASTVSGATLTWNTAGPTDTWTPASANANWLPDNVEWTDGNAAVFDNATGETITLSGTVSPASVAIGANNGNWIFTGTGSIGGSSTLTKTGTGTLMLATSNTYSGATSISGAGSILTIQNNAALGSAAGATFVAAGSQLQLQGGITVTGETLTILNTTGGSLLNLSGDNEWTGTVNANAGGSGSEIRVTAGKLTLSGNLVVVGSGSSFSINNNGIAVVSGIISGATAGFSIVGSGTTTISGANTFGDSTHGMTINSGTATVLVADSTPYAIGNQMIVTNGLGNSGNRFTFGANTGSSILQLRSNGQNDASPQTLTYGNNVIISGASGVNGTIDVGRQSGTGTGKILALGDVTTGPNGGTLNVTGGNDYRLKIGTVIIAGDAKTATLNPTTANLTLASVTNTSTKTGANTLRLDGSASGNTVTGSISDGASFATNVRKEGIGIWTLSGNSTYDGTTAINVGTLLINGNNAAASGAVTVANTATLGGMGIVGGATTVNNGATLAPGNGGPGTLTFNGNLNLAGGTSKMLFEGGDLVAVNGALSLASAWNLAVTGADFRNGGSVVLFNFASAGALNINADIDVSGLGFTPSSPLSLTNTGSSIILNGISSVYGIPKTTVLSIR